LHFRYRFFATQIKTGGNMKKFFLFIVIGVMILSSAACKKTANEPLYSSDEQFDIGMWVGISDKLVQYDEWGKKIEGSERYLTDEEFKEKYIEIAESGINIAYPGYEYMLWGTETYNKKCLKAASEVGIKQLISIPALNEYLSKVKVLVDSGIDTEEQAVEKVKDYLKTYTEYEYSDAFYGCFIGDEPAADKFDQHGYAEKLFNLAAPDLCYYVNLFPIIAGGSQLGGTNPINYDTYIAQYLEKVKTPYISYDHYPLKKAREYYLESSFLQNMQYIRKAVDEEGKNRKIWTFLQSMSFGNSNRSLESVGDATFQAYSFLAYGGSGIQWFCYCCPPAYDGGGSFGDDAPLDRNYEKTETYNYIQTADKYIQALMPYYKNFTWKGVMTSDADGGEGNFERIETLSGTDTVKAFEATEDSFMGVFEDKDGREGYMVVNFTDPGRKTDTAVTLTLSGVNNAIVVLNSQKTVVPIKKGKLRLELKSGEGCFVIPY